MKDNVHKEWGEHKGKVLVTDSEFDVIECSLCGFSHIIPIPSDEELNAYYSEEFVEERPLYIKRITEDLEWWRIVYNERYDLFDKHLKSNTKRIIEIGCGLGHFLETGKERGWTTLGIEPSKKSASYARNLGLEVINEMLSNNNVSSLGEFDVVYLQEVLEHSNDPQTFLKICLKLVKPGGIICIAVPNDFNPLQKGLTKELAYPSWWVTQLHINYFSFDSLEELLKSIGFDIIVRTTSFPMEFFLYMGKNYVGNDELGRDCHSLRKNFDIQLNKSGLLDIKQDLYTSLARMGIGRECIILARKPK
jgi:SAM-dependent methyltransferase